MNPRQKSEVKCFLQKFNASLVNRDDNSEHKHFPDIKQNEKKKKREKNNTCKTKTEHNQKITIFKSGMPAAATA